MHNIWGDVQDSQGRVEDAEGEEGGPLPEEHGGAGGAGGQARQGPRSDAQTSHPGHQDGELEHIIYFWDYMWLSTLLTSELYKAAFWCEHKIFIRTSMIVFKCEI